MDNITLTQSDIVHMLLRSLNPLQINKKWLCCTAHNMVVLAHHFAHLTTLTQHWYLQFTILQIHIPPGSYTTYTGLKLETARSKESCPAIGQYNSKTTKQRTIVQSLNIDAWWVQLWCYTAQNTHTFCLIIYLLISQSQLDLILLSSGYPLIL